MPAHSSIETPLERQLLVQLGGRLRDARKKQEWTSVDFARKVGISRTTLYAVENGDASPSLGTYVRVLSALGLSTDLALLGTGEGAHGPSLPREKHIPQDYQSLLMHQAAVQLIRDNPELVSRAQQTLERWISTGDPHTQPLWLQWRRILDLALWNEALEESERGQQLRQASPLSTLLPQETRLAIIREVKALKERGHAQA